MMIKPGTEQKLIQQSCSSHSPSSPLLQAPTLLPHPPSELAQAQLFSSNMESMMIKPGTTTRRSLFMPSGTQLLHDQHKNFNPFETFLGNSPDASGIYPGESRYKDPKRGEVSYALMQVERAEIEARQASPMAGDVPGCAGCKNGAPKN